MRATETNDIVLKNSDIPENVYEGSVIPVYVPGDTYVDEAVVYYDAVTPHMVYQSKADANQGNTPPVTPSVWLELGATDRWAMFDPFMNTQSKQQTSMEVEVGSDLADCVGFFNLQAKQLDLALVVDSNLLTGSFSFGSEWSESPAGTFICDGSQAGETDVVETLAAVATLFRTEFTLFDYSAGSIAGVIGTNTGDAINENGTYQQYILSVGGSLNCGVKGSADFIGKVKDISIMRCAKYETVDLTEHPPPDFYSYFFGSFEFKIKHIWYYPKYANAFLRVKITYKPGSDAKCGVMRPGPAANFGDTLEKPRIGKTDYSIVTETDAKNFYLKPGVYSDELDVDLVINSNKVDFVDKVLTRLRGKMVILDFNNSDTVFESLWILAVIRDFESVPDGDIADLSMDIKGLT